MFMEEVTVRRDKVENSLWGTILKGSVLYKETIKELWEWKVGFLPQQRLLGFPKPGQCTNQ